MYQEDAEARQHQLDLIAAENERRQGTGMIDLKRDDWAPEVAVGTRVRQIYRGVNGALPEGVVVDIVTYVGDSYKSFHIRKDDGTVFVRAEHQVRGV